MSDINAIRNTCGCKCTKLTRVGIAYICRFSTGLLLNILSSLAARYYNSEITDKYGSVFPYFIGGFVTGIAMTFFDFVNCGIWNDFYHGTATSKQKAHWGRSGTVISVVSAISGMAGSIICGIFGIASPYECRKYISYPHTRKCTEAEYQMTKTYELAIILVAVLLFSIIVNTIYVCQPDPFQSSDSSKCDNRSDGSHSLQHETLVQTSINSPVPASADSSSGFALSTGHRQPEQFQEYALSPEHHRPTAQRNYSSQVPVSHHGSSGLVLNTRHGQPEPFAGAVLSTRCMHRPTNNHESSGFVLNTRHGPPETFPGEILYSSNEGPISGEPSGFVLNTRHGQPEPFAGAILTSGAQEQVSVSDLVLELQEQNRLLREQLAIQQRQHGVSTEETVVPSAPVSESPPSYESLNMSSR
ncbi:uncharacterized protein LOC132755773 [Ruditapes philippinarum]|uniref:uncharacterized protein LOC132755773 n=1 Tax=Ruditapes philippinarum TaxID=129788 RepID=UPI00295B0C10|nr:uncharacterized protein LOC132755773 [Ruditapes philippinarum]